MGFVIQMQRRAVEALKEFVTSPWPSAETFQKQDVIFYMGKNEVHGWNETLSYLGLSEGFGTCSDIHGMDVAVFGRMPCNTWQLEQEGKDWRWVEKPHWERLSACSYAVLLWPDGHLPVRILETLHAGRLGHEIHRIALTSDNRAYGTVELLQFSSFESATSCTSTHVFLERTGLIASYVEM